MPNSLVTLGYAYFPDPTVGRPVSNGYIYVGEPDTDPEIASNQKTLTLRLEDGTETPTAQPVRTSAGGVPTLNGSSAEILADGNYSIKVLNSQLAQVYYNANRFDGEPLVVGESIFPYETVADMVADIGLQIGYFVQTITRNGNNDGGGGLYEIVAAGSTDNAFFIQLDNGFRAKLIINYPIAAQTLGLVGDGVVDNTSQYTDFTSNLTDSGITIVFDEGTYLFTGPITLEGAHFILNNDAELEFNGSDFSVYNTGGLTVGAGATLEGGTYFTSGTMSPPFQSDFATRSTVLRIDGGSVKNVTIYSQLTCGINHFSGILEGIRIFGAQWYGAQSYWTSDLSQETEVNTFNTGVRYVDKVPQATGNNSNVFAYLIIIGIVITQPVRVRFIGDYSSGNGLWFDTPTGSGADRGVLTINDLYLDSPQMDFAGTFLANGTTPTPGNVAGTAIEVISCPNARIHNPLSRDPRGFNLAIGYSDEAVADGGVAIGMGDDPNVVIFNCDDVTIKDHYSFAGTVGYSIGEDGAQANRARLINCISEGNNFGPIRFSFAEDDTYLFIDKFTTIRGGTAAAYAGDISGPGEMYDFCRCPAFNSATRAQVVFMNSTVSGEFTNMFIPNNTTTTLSITERNNTYNCPFVPVAFGEDFRGRGSWNSNQYIVPIFAADTGGRADSGIITLDNTTTSSAPVIALTDIEPYVGTQATASSDADNWYFVMYIKRSTDMNGDLRIGLDDSGGPDGGRVQQTIFLDSVISNSDAVVTNGYQIGEWMSVALPLRDWVYSGVTDYSMLTRMQIVKFGFSPNYELEMTKPVLVMSKLWT